MSFNVSPGVTVTEKDLTTIVPNIATTIGGTVGAYQWGPVDEITQISSENEFVKRFGKPNNDTFEDFFSVSNYLAYTNNMQVVRVIGAAGKNSVIGNTTLAQAATAGSPTTVAITANTLTLSGTTYDAGVKPGDRLILSTPVDAANEVTVTVAVVDSTTLITLVSTAGLTSNASDGTMTMTFDTVLPGTVPVVKNDTDWLAQTFTDQLFIGKFPGKTGNSLAIHTADAGNFSSWKYSNQFDRAPATSTSVDSAGGSNDEMHVIIVDQDGLFSGVKNQILEKHEFVSKALDAKKIDGSNNYVATVLERESQYIWMGLPTLYASDVGSVSTTTFTSQSADTFGDGVGSIVITNPGTGGTYAVGDKITATGGGGAGFAGRVTSLSGSQIASVVIDTQGTGYTNEPTLVVSSVTGTGAILTSVLSSLGKGGKLALAVDDNAAGITDSVRQLGWDKFANPDEINVSLLVSGGVSTVVSKYIKDNIADVRKDLVQFVSPTKSAVVNNNNFDQVDKIKVDATAIGSSSYVFMDSAWKYQLDRYNEVFRWVPLNADIAGLTARTDLTNDAWFSPAGLNRGIIKNAIKLSWMPSRAQQDTLYTANVNPVINFPGQGIVLFGDKTRLLKPSAFDRINVRRLFIVLEKSIAIAAKFSLFEQNDEFSRSQFKALVEPFLRQVQGRRGITDFKVVADSSNNPPAVVDANQFVGDIFVTPIHSINFIQLNFINTRTGTNFTEIGG